MKAVPTQEEIIHMSGEIQGVELEEYGHKRNKKMVTSPRGENQSKQNRRKVLIGVFSIVFIVGLIIVASKRAIKKQELMQKQKGDNGSTPKQRLQSNAYQKNQKKNNPIQVSPKLPDNQKQNQPQTQETKKEQKKETSVQVNKPQSQEQKYWSMSYQQQSRVNNPNPSGVGSLPSLNSDYLVSLQHIVDSPQIKKIVEIGFGDWNLAGRIHYSPNQSYVGYEVVQGLLRKDTQNMKFRLYTGVRDFDESGDLLIEKDVRIHWPNADHEYFMTHVAPKFKYIVTSFNYAPGPRNDIRHGQWAPYNIENVEKKELLHMWYQRQTKEKRTYIIPESPYPEERNTAPPIHEEETRRVQQWDLDFLTALQHIVDSPKIKKVVEVGYGDWNIASRIHFTKDKSYYGFEEVDKLRLDESNKKFGLFLGVDEFTESGDLLIVKDLNWPNAKIEKFLQKTVPRFKFTILGFTEGLGVGQISAQALAKIPNEKLLTTKNASGQEKRIHISPKHPYN